MTPEEAYNKSKKENHRVLELENIIAEDPEYSYHYASNVIRGPFRKGHVSIFNSNWKYNYINFLQYNKFDLQNEIGEWLI